MVIETLKQIDWSSHKLLVAFSGGLDSTVLVHALKAIGERPKLIHVNYHLRGNESDLDEQFTIEFAEKLGLEIQIEHCSPDSLKRKGTNLQEAARDFRRNLFREWNSQSSNNCVVLGHHKDDQIETFWLQLIRGNSIFGLGGMREFSDQLARPFLNLSKSDLLEYAKKNNLLWREDQSNSENNYARNKIRNTFIPQLLELNPSMNEHVLLLQSHFRNQQDEILKSIQPIALHWQKEKAIEIEMWEKWNDDQHMAVLKLFKWPFWMVQHLNQLVNSTLSKQVIFGDLVIYRTKEHLSWQTEMNENTAWDYKSEVIQTLPEIGSKNEIYLDSELLVGELNWRFAQPTDWISPVGMIGKQSVFKVLKDAGIPVQMRHQIKVLSDDTTIHWIPELKISRVALAQSSTTKIIRVSRTKQHD